MDPLKEAFGRVRQDIEFLKKEIGVLADNLKEIRRAINSKKEGNLLFEEVYKEKKNTTDTDNFPTHSAENPTDTPIFKPLNSKNYHSSTGNQGVPTDRQTDRQTDRHIRINGEKYQNASKDAFEILNSLDALKKEIRLKFKKITNQELLVFSTIYQFDEEQKNPNYRIIAEKLHLSESSVRDYVGKLIKKGIPIEKKKINNKNIQLSVSSKLKKIAPLDAILRLREL